MTGLIILLIVVVLAILYCLCVLKRYLHDIIRNQKRMENERKKDVAFHIENYTRLEAWHKEHCTASRGKSLTARLDERVQDHVTDIMKQYDENVK